MKFLITGATGFLGSNLVKGLAEKGHIIYAGKRKHSNCWRLEYLYQHRYKFEIVDLDITDTLNLNSKIKKIKPEIVINCAAYGINYNHQNLKLSYETNVLGAYNLLEQIPTNTQVFVQIGSCSEYGSKKNPITENEILKPTTIYGASKAASTLLLLQGAQKLRKKICILRPFNLWGDLEGDYRLVPQIISACHLGNPLELTPGDQIHDYTYIRDLVDKIISIALMDNFPNGQIINLGNGQPVILKNFIKTIAQLLGGEDLMQFGKLPYRASEMMCQIANITKQNQIIKEKITPLKLALDNMKQTMNLNHRK